MTDRLSVLAAVAAGGALGAAARYGLGVAWPEHAGGFPWTTFTINVTGSFALGLLLASLEMLTAPHRLLRPMLGTGALGGYTTFSTYAEQARVLVSDGQAVLAAIYVFGTLAGALAAVWLGMLVVRAAEELRRRM